LLALGIPLPQVSRILGHSHVGITARVYAHALADGEQVIMERLGEPLTGRVAVSVAVKEPQQAIEMA